MKLGIVGLPNAGKTTVFNALTHAGALATAYAFSSAEANHGVVAVPDERLDRLNEVLQTPREVHATIEVVDIPGLAGGGGEHGQGLGSRFLSDIREVDAVAHVVRAFENPEVAFPRENDRSRGRRRGGRDRAHPQRPRAGRAPPRQDGQGGALGRPPGAEGADGPRALRERAGRGPARPRDRARRRRGAAHARPGARHRAAGAVRPEHRRVAPRRGRRPRRLGPRARRRGRRPGGPARSRARRARARRGGRVSRRARRARRAASTS